MVVVRSYHPAPVRHSELHAGILPSTPGGSDENLRAIRQRNIPSRLGVHACSRDNEKTLRPVCTATSCTRTHSEQIPCSP